MMTTSPSVVVSSPLFSGSLLSGFLLSGLSCFSLNAFFLFIQVLGDLLGGSDRLLPRPFGAHPTWVIGPRISVVLLVCRILIVLVLVASRVVLVRTRGVGAPTVLASSGISTGVRIRVRWDPEPIGLSFCDVSTCVRVWVRRDQWAPNNVFY